MPKPIAPEAVPVDDFANAFLEAVKADETAATAEPPAPVEKPAEVPAETQEETAPAAAVEEQGEKAPETEEQPAEVVETVEEIEPPEAKMARLEAENAALRAPKPAEKAPEKAPERAEAPPQRAEAPAPEPPRGPAWYTPAPEEQTALESYRKDWPDVAAATDVLVKQAAYNAVEYVFDVLRKQVLPRMQQYEEMSNVMAERMTLDVLHVAHPDYDSIYEDVVAWVDTLPAAFKHGAKQVMAQGSPTEVSELIATFKEAKGGRPPAPSMQPKTELSAAAKQAASKLRVVGSKRTTPAATPDPNDFDAAWDEAVRSGS